MPDKIYQTLEIEQIENLVFQGGSVKGIAYLGAWEALLQLGLKPEQIKRVGGASAGSITALLIALGYTKPLELLNIMKELSFTDMLDEPNAIIPVSAKIMQMNDKFKAGTNASTISAFILAGFSSPTFASKVKNDVGLFEGNYLEAWFEALISKRTGINKCTFEQLAKLKDERPDLQLKDLYVVAYNLDSRLSDELSYEKTPDAVISESIRASMSIPFVFKPKTVVHSGENNHYVDGGLFDNYPLYLFDHLEFGRTTLGFQLLSQEKIDRRHGKKSDAPKPEPTFFSVTKAVFNTRSAAQNNHQMHNYNQRSRTVEINNLGVDTLDFNLTEEMKSKLIESGRTGTLAYFESAVPTSESDVLAKIDETRLANAVSVYVWASSVNPNVPGHAFGHVSIETHSQYISLWPKNDAAPQEQARKRHNVSKYSSSAESQFQASLQADILASHGMEPTRRFYFETLSSQDIEAKFAEIKKSITGWTLFPGLCSNNESCASIAMTLLEAGNLNRLVPKIKRGAIASTGSMLGSQSMFTSKPDVTRKEKMLQGSTYALEMALSTIYPSPDAMLEVLDEAEKNEIKMKNPKPKMSAK